MSKFLEQKYRFDVFINDPAKVGGSVGRSGTVTAETDDEAKSVIEELCRAADRDFGCTLETLIRCSWENVMDMKQQELEGEMHRLKTVRQEYRSEKAEQTKSNKSGVDNNRPS